MPHKASYSKFFTPPRFLEMPSVSVEILPGGIYFLTTRNTDRGLLPDKFGFIPLSPGDVIHGEVVKREPVVKALIDIRKRTGVNFVRFSIPEEKTYIFKTHLPELKPHEIHDVLDFKLEENIPLSSKESVFDYDVLKTEKHSNGLDVVVSAAPIKVVEDMQALFHSAGLIPLFISPESNNVARAVVRTGNEQVLVIVNIREANIVLSLVVSGIVYQTSSINIGSSAFTDLLAKHYQVSFAEAAKIKIDKLYVDSQDGIEIFSQIINTVSAIKDEISRFVSYCNEREDISTKVDRIILCGQDAKIIGLVRYLSSNLGLPLEVANVWTNNFDLDDYIPELDQVSSLNYATVSGLSLF